MCGKTPAFAALLVCLVGWVGVLPVARRTRRVYPLTRLLIEKKLRQRGNECLRPFIVGGGQRSRGTLQK